MFLLVQPACQYLLLVDILKKICNKLNNRVSSWPFIAQAVRKIAALKYDYHDYFTVISQYSLFHDK